MIFADNLVAILSVRIMNIIKWALATDVEKNYTKNMKFGLTMMETNFVPKIVQKIIMELRRWNIDSN